MQTRLKLTDKKYRAALTVILLLCLGTFAYRTLDWPLVGDATLIHYVVFLTDHGLKPYRDINDVNMPGSYVVDWAVMHLFGTGALAWRLFDLTLLLLGGAAMFIVARPCGWFPALFASVLFALAHGRDGVAQLGQRDLTIAVLLLWACACLFHARRSGARYGTALFGLFSGMACLIKPTAVPFFVGLVVLAVIDEKRNSQDLRLTVLASLTGFLIPLGFVAILLSRWSLWSAFIATMTGIVRYHASVARHPLGFLLSHSISPFLPLVIASSLLLFLKRSYKIQWETRALGLCVFLSLASYCLQAKGYPYQRYPFLAFLLLLIAIQMSRSFERQGLERILAATTFFLGAVIIAPISTKMAISYESHQDEFGSSLQRDLTQLGGPALSGHVQCLDTFSGCIGTLYQMKLVQSTSLMYDEFLFGPEKNGVIATNRERFWRQVQLKAPDVFVVSQQLYPDGPDSFEKTSRWPLLADHLGKNYVLFIELRPSHVQRWGGRAAIPAGYRIYLRRGFSPNSFTKHGFELIQSPVRLQHHKKTDLLE